MSDNWIENVCEPERLYLGWQAPDEFNDRYRWAVGEIIRNGSEALFRYFADDEHFRQLNDGKSHAELEALSYRGYPAFARSQLTHAEGVLSAFLRRLPPDGRPDIAAYKQTFRLPAELPITPFGMLGYSEAKLPSDGFCIVNPLQPPAERCELMIEIAGFRYYKEKVAPLVLGQGIRIAPEPTNEHDPNAVQLIAGTQKIGNINRLQTAAFHSWLKNRKMTAVVERLNGRPDKPRVHLFVRVEPVALTAAA